MAGLIALGIDLGTTYSVAATMISGVGTWYPRVLANPSGKDLSPSSVYFDPNDRQVVIGEDALQLWREQPLNVIRWVKRKMGNSNCNFKVVCSNGGEYFTPQQISSYILNYLVTYAQQRAPDSALKKLVVTVPAFFGDNERQATLDAARLLDLEAILIEEPTAAILDYLYEKIYEGSIKPEQGEKYFAVFDLGGGTFDISVAVLTWDVEMPVIRILATQGHRQLGGFDFDIDLCKLTIRKLLKKYPENTGSFTKLMNCILEWENNGIISDANVWRLFVELMDVVEAAKRHLSTVNSRRVYLPPNDFITSGNLHVELKRTDINNILEPRINDIKDRVALALTTVKENTNGYLDSWNKLEHVILVGGSTRIPVIRDLVIELFGQAPRLDGHEDLSVARGAAIYAGIIAGLRINGRFQRKTVHSYGIYDKGEFTTIIPRGTVYPPATAQIQHPVKFVLSPKANLIISQSIAKPDGEEYEKIKEIDYYHPILYTDDELTVTLSIDINGLLQIKAEDYTKEQVEESVESIELTGTEKDDQRKQIQSWPMKYI